MIKNILKITLSGSFLLMAQVSAPKRTVLDVVTSIKPLQAIITGYVNEYVKESWMQDNNIISCACSADNRRLAVVYESSIAVSLFDIPTKKLMRVINNPEYIDEYIDVLAFSPDGKYLVCGSTMGNIFVWDAPACLTCQLKDKAKTFLTTIAKLNLFWRTNEGYRWGSPCRLKSLMFSPDSQYLLQHDNTDVKIMNVSTQQAIQVAHSSGAESVTYYGKKNNFVATHKQLSASEAGLILWDDSTLKIKRKIPREELGLGKIAASRDGKYLALASRDCVKILSISDLSIMQMLAYDKQVLKLEFGPDGALYIVTKKGIDRWSSLDAILVDEDASTRNGQVGSDNASQSLEKTEK